MVRFKNVTKNENKIKNLNDQILLTKKENYQNIPQNKQISNGCNGGRWWQW